jgi:hypothetical protein
VTATTCKNVFVLVGCFQRAIATFVSERLDFHTLSSLLCLFDLACVGPDNNVVAVLHVGAIKASNIKLVLHHEPRTGKLWLHTIIILPNEDHVGRS